MMYDQKMLLDVEQPNSVPESGDGSETEILDASTKTDLGNLALQVDIMNDDKEAQFNNIDALFGPDGKINQLDENQKNEALKFALKEAKIKMGSGDNSIEVSVIGIAQLFGKYVNQDGDSWKLNVESITDENDKKFEGALRELVSSPKQSPLAYLIQKASNFAKIQAENGYGEETEANRLREIKEDKILGNQTRRALAGLKSWVEGGKIDENNIPNMTVDQVLEMKYISADLKDKLIANGTEEVKQLWEKAKGDNPTYEYRVPYTNNYALQLKQRGNQNGEGSVDEEPAAEAAEHQDESGETGDILVIQEKYGCQIQEKEESGHKTYKVKKGTESFTFSYEKEENVFSFSAGGNSFSISVGEGADQIVAFNTALDQSVKIAAEIANIMTKAKNNPCDLAKFELSSNDKNLEADYERRIVDFGSWIPIGEKYSGVIDITLLKDIEGTLGIDPATFCEFMNEHYKNQKGKTAAERGDVEITTRDGKTYEVESHGQKISFTRRGEDTFVFKTRQGTELLIRGTDEYAAHAAAVINYIVSIVKHSPDKLDCFEKDGDSIQADYEWRYFDIDLLDNVEKTLGVSAQTFTTFMNSYRKDVGI